MIAIAPLLVFMTPALPPSGPIWGQIECLFDASKTQESGWVRFSESGLPYSGPLTLMQEKQEDPQAQFVQFPVNGDGLSDVEFAADGTITINAGLDRRVVGKFAPLQRSLDEHGWMEFSVPGPAGEMIAVGKCLADVRGRLERPIRLARINTMRVD